MRTRLLSLIIFLSCLTCFGQFGIEQPFFLQSSTTWTPASVPGLMYWWHSADLPDGPVNTWTDRISGVQFKLATGSGTNTPNGIYFSGTTKYTNDAPVVTTNYCRGAVMNVLLSTVTTINRYWSFWGTNDYTTAWHFYDSGPATPLQWREDDIINNIPTGNMTDIVMCESNTAVAFSYTNGVFAKLHGPVSSTGVNSPISWLGDDDNANYPFHGYIKELAVWTNIIDWRPYAADFHVYATNIIVSHSIGTNFIHSVTLGAVRNNFTGRVGFKFSPLVQMTVTSLGRWIVAGNSGSHLLVLKNSAAVTLQSVTLNTSLYSSDAFAYTNITATDLVPRNIYYVESTELNGGDQFRDLPCVVTPYSWIGEVICAAANEGNQGTNNNAYGPVDFLFND